MENDDILWQLGLVVGGFVVVLVLGRIVGGIVGRVCRLVGLPAGLGALVGVLFPFVALLAASLYLDQAGVVAPARVESKQEQIRTTRSRGPNVYWTRQLQATVSFTAADGRPATAMMLVDEKRFDDLRPGAMVMVRYLPEARFFARPADQSIWDLVPWSWLPTIGLVIMAAAGIWLMIRLRAPKPLTAVAIGAGIFGLMTLLFPPWAPELTGPLQTATAEVRDVRTVTRSVFSGRSGWDAPQPWEMVELVFVPIGRDQPVVAIDSVDRGSVAGLADGARLPVTYSVDAPRSAQLTGAARTYRMREWLGLAETAMLIGVVLGGIWLLGKVLGGLWRRAVAGRSGDV